MKFKFSVLPDVPSPEKAKSFQAKLKKDICNGVIDNSCVLFI